MNILYDRKHTKTDIYTYQINSGGEFFIQESGQVTIIFENRQFVHAKFPLVGNYTRNGWRILAAINEEIGRIEDELQCRKATSD